MGFFYFYSKNTERFGPKFAQTDLDGLGLKKYIGLILS